MQQHKQDDLSTIFFLLETAEHLSARANLAQLSEKIRDISQDLQSQNRTEFRRVFQNEDPIMEPAGRVLEETLSD